MRHSLNTLTLTNAAGMVKTKEEARTLLSVPDLSIVTVGSITLNPRPGNLGETYYFDPESKTALNARGLPNPGLEETLRWLHAFREECNGASKELCVSIAGTSPEEYGELTEALFSSVDILEVNAGCPNVWGPDGRKPIASYDPALLSCILTEVRSMIRDKCRIGVKVSPVPDDLIPGLAGILAHHPEVSMVVATNTMPDQGGNRPDGSQALAFREREGAETKNVGGLSGSPLKAHGLRVVHGLRERLMHTDVRIIGCGGIFEGQDLVDYLDAGAHGVAIGTGFFESGPRIFSDVLAGAYEILEAR
ncbi:MAG TPA: hypothetical protein VGE48_01080 [Candidatus Paceibacterota bacterium]